MCLASQIYSRAAPSQGHLQQQQQHLLHSSALGNWACCLLHSFAGDWACCEFVVPVHYFEPRLVALPLATQRMVTITLPRRSRRATAVSRSVSRAITSLLFVSSFPMVFVGRY